MSLKKTATQEKPHAVFQLGDWEWRVLKAYKNPVGEAKDQYARWFCAVKSPFTFGGFEWGDVYVTEITGNAVLTAATDEWRKAYNMEEVA